MSIFKKLTLAVDLGGYGGAASSEHPGNQRFFKELVGYFDIVKVSSEDCRYLLDVKEDGDVADLFVRWGANIGIVTLGEKGCIVATKTDKFKIPTFPSKVVDHTGAGDVYSAGFLTEYLRTRDVRKSAVFAYAIASLVIESTDGVTVQRMPTISEVYERINLTLKQKKF